VCLLFHIFPTVLSVEIERNRRWHTQVLEENLVMPTHPYGIENTGLKTNGKEEV
jgi:hypothetical protein